MYSKLFWRDATERVAVTVAEFLLVLGGADGAEFLNMDAKHVIILSLFGGFAALLKAVVAVKATPGNSASLTVNNVEYK